MRFLRVCIIITAAVPVVRLQDQDECMNQTTRDRINLDNLSIPNTGTLFSLKGPAGKVSGDT